ncbi:tRNA(Ile)-lysidine synthase [Sporomusa ovata DSM 2662]|uniref:tRNA(Ile)-lysidine synthase n=1 Tax=Sporomusa ovata TaxID=2378 RepID=A0A0U1KZW3_9FIRM|nr:tRNA lysidine(34) synthetase TilS [Sporomusa ovata]EQB28010.1 tRNA(Ile)-lysidine synthase [Sporomusa ovata DSM 2662]CQR72951.1 tRNA(Ile)-lysidine synthetase [Sporomusa ovata]
MLNKVKTWLNNYRLVKPGGRILAACSGGPDSLALVHILHRLKDEHGFSLAVAHVNHMLRPEAPGEAEFVEAFSTSLGLKCFVTAIDVSAYSKANKISSQEEAARLLRYQCLRRIAAAWGGAMIATGHHRDDQVETVLLNFLRGAGSGGLRGMKPLNGDVIRPLLAVSRPEIEAYCEEQGLQPRRDSSNFSTEYRRNRIRLELLPVLEKSYNPAIREAIWRLASLVGDEHDYICGEAAKLWGNVAKAGDCVVIESQGLAALPIALQRELIRQAIEKKRGSLTGISFEHVEKLLTMVLSGTVGSLLTLPGGYIARKTYTGLVVENGVLYPSKPVCTKKLKTVTVVIPGSTTIGSSTIVAELATALPLKKGKNSAAFDLEKLTLPLVVRSRAPGDRFRPAGLNGSKKLKNFFIDDKIPEAVRNFVPIVADQHEIIWVAGYRQSEHARITETTKKILQLTITKQEEF